MYYIDPVHYIASHCCDEESSFIKNLLSLLDEGATIPFIARYRKEVTGSMDEVKIEKIVQCYNQFKEFEKRKTTVLNTIGELDKLTPELQREIESCEDPQRLEDIYLPYKPKRQTRASKARERGLEPLAMELMRQERGDVTGMASHYLSGEVADEEEALQGARDIIAEWFSEDEQVRNGVRFFFNRQAVLFSRVLKGKEEEGIKYSDYFDYSEPLKRVPSHRVLALLRGEREGFLKIGLEIDNEEAIGRVEHFWVKGVTESAEQVRQALHDGYKRLLLPSIESEYMSLAKERADGEAIKVFSENLRQLLLAPPLGNKRVLGIDPGFRTGCKLVCLDESGNLMYNETIYPHPPQSRTGQAAAKVAQLVSAYKIEAIAIGNGTAGRETERFIQNIRYDREILIFSVNESGASIYSASKIARDEFPDYDITVRGAVSIGRRLMDPLAELVKIDPKSIGVGQYQHDVDQNRLREGLERVVESCVNRVGVNVNSASKYLLTYISGLGPTLAGNIVEYIKENGQFRKRSDLKKVKRMGEKSFELSAGFLRIEEAEYPLDNSSVHPESYPVVEQMAKDMDVGVGELIGNEELVNKIDLNRYVADRIGLPTLKDIVEELKKPGRDPRSVAKVFSFAENIHSIDDLREGIVVPGVVTNITNFGAFVDIGVKQDGLVHISEIANRYISNPADELVLNQHVMVKVVQIDKARKRIGLSIRQADGDNGTNVK